MWNTLNSNPKISSCFAELILQVDKVLYTVTLELPSCL